MEPMTRRERLEARLSRRKDWAASRRQKAAVVAKEAEQYRGDHAFNTQPGHIPERARLIRREDRAYEDLQMAEHHEQRASGIADQLDRSIFSDDADAVTALSARIAEREAEAARHVAINKAWRKAKGTPAEQAASLIASGACGPALAKMITETMALCPWLKAPLNTTNIRAAIRRDRERIAEIERRRAKGG